MAKSLKESLKKARNAAVPILTIETPDQRATITTISEAVNGDSLKFVWDCVNGLMGTDKAAAAVVGKVLGSLGIDPLETTDMVTALKTASSLPASSVLFMLNAHLFAESAPVIQAISNLRDVFKQDQRTLILLAPMWKVRIELGNDVVEYSEPLPDEAALAEIVKSGYRDAELKPPKPDVLKQATDALLGIAAFPAEQIVAMSLTPEGVVVDELWERKRKEVEKTDGLKINRSGEKFADIAGVENAKKQLRRAVTGRIPVRGILFIDELDKAMAASDSDTSGVTQDQLGLILNRMEDLELPGALFFGPPGATKSMLAKALGNEIGVPTIKVDFGGMKAKHVGESEQNIRMAWRVAEAITGGALFVIGTCNRHVDLKPELKRRFTEGVFYFDLLDDAEQESCWKLYEKKYDIPKQPRPECKGWTGAEIRNCCRKAWSANITLIEAAETIVPVAKSQMASINELRRQANGVFISASYNGTYQMPEQDAPMATAPTAKRKVSL